MKNLKHWRKRTTEEKLDRISMALLQLELIPIDERNNFYLGQLIKVITKTALQTKAKKLRRRLRRIEEGKFEDK